MTDEQKADIKKALTKISRQRLDLEDYYKYYKGEHRLNFASSKFRNKFGARLQSLKDNLCKSVVNAPVSRLEVINFADEQADITEKAWSVWKANSMPLQAKSVHREAFRAGYSFVIVWQDLATKKAKIDIQKSHSVCLFESEESNLVSMGAKVWMENEMWFLTLYYPDRIEKFVTVKKSKDFPTKPESFVERGDGETWKVENPFKLVPVFKFSATEDLSILDEVIPLNDALNKTFCDLMVGGEYNSIRQRFTAGIQYEKDEETGKPIIPYEHDDQVWSSESDTAKFGEFSDVELEQFLKTADSIRQEIARVTGIPAHYFNLNTGDFPSGEALRTAEARFISLIEEAQLSFGETWSKVIQFCLQIENDAPDAQIEVQWRDAAPTSESEKLTNALAKQQLGLSAEIYLAELGYTEQQIVDSLNKQAEKQASLGESLGKIFDGGLNAETVN
jgi:hypothetical protein